MAEAAEREDGGDALPVEPLDGGTYEIIRHRLLAHGQELRTRLERLNTLRKEVFGSIETRLLSTERITTENNCIPRDMVAVGSSFLFGYNVRLGLRSETRLSDVFAVYQYQDRTFRGVASACIADERFEADFKELYKYYRSTSFSRFAVIGATLHMVFRVGKEVTDIKTFKWQMEEDGCLTYIGNRSDHEYVLPAQHEFEWIRTTRDMHRGGLYPHISIDNRVFVEAVGGDLTIKVEDNTDSGEGIYAEAVEDPDQTLDDGEIYYAVVGNLVLLKIRPYKEKVFRYIIFSEKAQEAVRIDAIETACVLLPEDHGVIFANGYYLQTGEHKTFENALQGMSFERRIPSPNGEDFLYAFTNQETGEYILLSYNLIEQRVNTPVICHGYSIFENGEMIYFRRQEEPQKHHAIQLWQTPFVGPNYLLEAKTDSQLYKIGNRDIVRCMAECSAVQGLIGRDEAFSNLYVDIVRVTTDVLDTYFWLDSPEAGGLREPLERIREAGSSAIEEFEKVVRVRKSTREQVRVAEIMAMKILAQVKSARFEGIDEFVAALGQLRAVRGEVIALRELKYIDPLHVDTLEGSVSAAAEALAGRCVAFLLKPGSLAPYQARVEEQKGRIQSLTRVTEARELEKAIAAGAGELEMLVDVVSNLKIDDATQRTAIIENISVIYSALNAVRATVKNRLRDLASVEGEAEFGSQMKLLNQAVINYLDVCDTPERVEEYLSKLMIQVEELEGRFADYDGFVEELITKREEVYNAFENRKLQLMEARSKKADALLRSAERILKGIRSRIESFSEVQEINGYFASDLMAEKVRDMIVQLTEMGDSVKADDIQSRLKTVREDAVRQLKDRKELYVKGENVIRFGNHHFSVNTQKLDLTIVNRDGEPFLHLTGTDFFEPIIDEALLATRAVWEQELVSEDPAVYRAEYLAYHLFRGMGKDGLPSSVEMAALDREALKVRVQQFMGPRYAEGYTKGVHDADATLILSALLDMHAKIGLLCYHTRARALAQSFWYRYSDGERKPLLEAKLHGAGVMNRVFSQSHGRNAYISELRELLAPEAGSEEEGIILTHAAFYLFEVLSSGQRWVISPEAAEIYSAFNEYLRKKGTLQEFTATLERVKGDPRAGFTLLTNWVRAYVASLGRPEVAIYCEEVAALLETGSFDSTRVIHASVTADLTGLIGAHPRIVQGRYRLEYNDFMVRLARFETETVPRFLDCQACRKRVVAEARGAMRLEEFTPRVLTSFVRNRLIDSVYLPLVGDNLAKQIGVVGAGKRTDLMGLLLLISPPGYGKTTLMEYIANRLGIIFMKINGPAIGHRVTSIDPAEAPNAAAREELNKLGLALEMGDNVMIYLDDIQHCNPELLQKFISLCDGQRRIEGVYKGKTRTYDLRGKKVAVVMAGNPYTESGEAFQIPDMLANRADTYNLGDIIGDSAEAFKLSYLENALTSNAALNPLASRNGKDIYGLIRIAETGSREGVELESNYTAEEMSELVAVLKKLLRVRDVILQVNLQYIRSAAQADAYRTEPPFKLQGSYRNMNRIAEKVLPVMNDAELERLLITHYENEAQTLTTGTEANLLKFKMLNGIAGPAEQQRWEDICRTFTKNLSFQGVGGNDRAGQVVVQLANFSEGLEKIRSTLGKGIAALTEASGRDELEEIRTVETILADSTMAKLGSFLQGLKPDPSLTPPRPEKEPREMSLSAETLAAFAAMLKEMAGRLPAMSPGGASTLLQGEGALGGMQSLVPRVEVVNKVPRGMLHVMEQQSKLLEAFLMPLLEQSSQQGVKLNDLQDRLDSTLLSYKNLILTIDKGNKSH